MRTGAAAGVLAGPGGGAVAGVRVGHEQLGPHPGELLEVPLGAAERLLGGEVVQVADVLAEPGVAALGDRAGVLQVGARRRAPARTSNGSATGSGA